MGIGISPASGRRKAAPKWLLAVAGLCLGGVTGLLVAALANM